MARLPTLPSFGGRKQPVAPPKDKQSKFLRFLDLLSRPSQAVLRPIQRSLDRRGSITFPELKTEVLRGIRGQGRRATGRKIIETAIGKKLPGVAGVPLGIGLEVLTDPSNIFIPGIARKVVVPLGRATFSKVIKPILENVPTTKRALTSFGRIFLTDAKRTETIEALTKAGMPRLKAEIIGTQFAQRVKKFNERKSALSVGFEKRVAKLEDKLKTIPANERNLIPEFIERKGKIPFPLSKETVKVAGDVNKILGEKGLLRRLERRLLSPKALENLEEVGYITRIISPSARKFLSRSTAFKGIGSRFSDFHLSTLKRRSFESVVLPRSLPSKQQFAESLTDAGIAPQRAGNQAARFEKAARVIRQQINAGVRNVPLSNPNINNITQSLRILERLGIQIPKRRAMTIGEINALAREGKLKIPGLKGRKIDEFFMTDPATIAAIRGERTIRATSGAKFIRELSDPANGFAIDVSKLPANSPLLQVYRAKAPFVTKLTGNPNLRFPEEIAKEVERASQLLQVPEEMNFFLSMLDTITGWWKGWTTSVRPAFHFRNVAGNLFNTNLSGLNWAEIGDSSAIAINVLNGRKGVLKTAMGNITYDKVRTLIKNSGIRGKSIFTEDITPRLFPRTGAQKALNVVFGSENPLVKAGRSVGQAMEDYSRVSLFIGHLIKGKKGLGKFDNLIEFSRDKVRRFLFDYDELTEIERKVLRRMFPFYTWTRKNYPIQAESVFLKPSNILFPLRLKRNIESSLDYPPDERFLPEWVKERFPVNIGIDPSGQWRYVTLQNWLPAVDLQELMKGDFFWSLLNPLITKPIEFKTNYSLFLNKQFVKFPGQKTKFAGFEIDKKVDGIIRSVAFVNEIERLVMGSGAIFGNQTKPGIFGVRTTSPLELPSKVRIINALGDDEFRDALVRFLTGLKVIRVDPEKQRRIFEIKQQIEAANLEKLQRQALKRDEPGNVRQLQKLLDEIRKGK